MSATNHTSFSATLARVRGSTLRIAVAATFGCAIGLGLSFFIRPKYEAVITIMPVDHRAQRGELSDIVSRVSGLAQLVGSNTAGDERAEALAVLRSRALSVAMIEERNLRPILFHKRWDNRAGQWRSKDTTRIPTLGEAFKRFDKQVRRVSEDRRTGIVTLSILWSDPDVAAQWATYLVEKANEDLRQRAILEAEESIAYLNKELVKTSVVEIRQAIYRLLEIKINAIMLANVQKEYAFRVIDPAAAPDEKDFAWPLRPLFAVAGLVVGALIGLAWVSVRRD